MDNIKYYAMEMTEITPSMFHDNSNIQGELIYRLADRLVRHTNLRIFDILERRLGHKVEPEKLAGRLKRVVTRGAGYETLLLDGRPFARVYEATVTTNELRTTAKQVIKELDG